MPLSFPPELPISARVVDIAKAIETNQVVIVAGETGSGKTTQLPKICLAMGRGVDKRIACTQPRRIAATSVAARVAHELGSEVGKDVGYKIRFDDRLGPGTYVAFMTDGILLAEIQGDPLLNGYDTIIVDEAHERSLNIDFLIGYLKRILPKRPDLRVIISSATLEIERFRKLFDDAPLVKVEGRTYPVELVYRSRSEDDTDLSDMIATTVQEITAVDPRGDILVFLPGEREIREANDELLRRSFRHTVVLPLYGRLAAGDQSRVFDSMPQRKIVLATNVAETSLTIPGIIFVIDAGLARVNRYVPRTGVTQLQIESISRASADQRKGRCGRVQSGVCFRLCTEQEHMLRPEHTDPEILRTGLASVLLKMKSQGLGEVDDFAFLDPPNSRAVAEGYRVLEELGALDDKRELTPIGRQLARFPIDPRLARMILAADKEGALAEVLVLAAVLGIQDPRERPASAQREADEAQKIFRDDSSDFLGWMKLWRFFDEAQAKSTKAQIRKICRDKFLSYVRMLEWRELHQQLSRIAKDMGLKPVTKAADPAQIHRSLLPGLLSRIGMWNKESRSYVGARQTRFQLHPSSGLARKTPPWVMVAELVETSQLFARHAAGIDPAWLEEAGAHLIKRSHGDPHWEQKPARVSAREQITLYGLLITKERRVDYGVLDPPVAHRIFVEHALVRGEYKTKGTFQDHNQKVFDEARRLRDKARRSDMLADESLLAVFFEQRVPAEIVDGKSFEAWREKAEKIDPKILHLTLADVLMDEAKELSAERYPSRITVDGLELMLRYVFDPSEDNDGISVDIPLTILPRLEPAVLEAMVPGWMLEKITALLHGLSRGVKRDLGSIPELAARITPLIHPFVDPLLPTLSAVIRDEIGVDVPIDAWRPDDMAPYLRLLFRILDENDRVMASGRDLRALQERLGIKAREAWREAGASSWEKTGIRSWDFGDLAESVPFKMGSRSMSAFPALIDKGNSLDLALLPSRAQADEATRLGLRRLFALQLRTTLESLELKLPKVWPALPPAMPKAAESEMVRQAVIGRAIDQAFDLDDVATWPRTKRAFSDRLDLGRSRLLAVFEPILQVCREVVTELEKTLQALRAAESRPTQRSALDDIRSQLTHLVSASAFARLDISRAKHVPRYLRAIQVRLQRLPNDPVKDQQKATQVKPFWESFLSRQDSLRAVDPQGVEEFRWLVEELRVSIFAPELKTAVPVSQKRVEEMWKSLA